MIKRCVICGKEFNSPPSAKTVTCSLACRKERARRANIGRHIKWSDAAKAKLRLRGWHTKNLKKGTSAAQASPISGPFETNKNALIWTIISPEGMTFKIRNLNLWIRQNAEILPGTPEQARAGFMQIKRSMQGRTKRPVNQWKGWRLIGWEKPKES